jgi:cell division protein FtsI (penicillin-binding protein 3)
VNHKSPFSILSMRIVGEKSSNLSLAHGRIVLIVALFILAYIVVVARLVDATLIEGYLKQHDETSAADQIVDDENLRRADIVDRNGVILATSLKTASVYADPKLVTDPIAAAKALAKIFPDMAYGEVLKKLQDDRRFVWIRRNLTPDEQKKILEIGEPGLAFDYDYRRIYPQGRLAAHMVGYSDIDGKGLSGIERSFNSILKKGNDPIRLTLDIRLQHILRRELQAAIRDFTAVGGTGMIMDVNTGEVLAAVSVPDFDPNVPGSDANSPAMFNRATLGVYEIGSIFKTFTTAALLEKKRAPMTMTFDAKDPIKIGRFSIKDFHPENRTLTVPEVFMLSSNIGTAHMGEYIGTDGLRSMFRDLGLMSKVDFEIDEVGSPLVPSPWREVSTLTTSYGHGIAVTPLQLVRAMCTVVNGGLLVTPRLVLEDGSENEAFADNVKTRILSKETSLKMRQLLRLVVTDGTATKADVPGYMVGGKTGTADKNSGGRYDRNKRMSSFVGVFPMSDPKYAVLIMVDEPKPNKSSYGYATAGWVAAPAVARVISAAGLLLNIKPVEDESDISEPLRQFISTKVEEH